MNPKLSLILVIFYLTPLINLGALGQNYTPFDFENGIWIEDYFAYGEPQGILYHNQYYSDGDTIISDTKYYKLRRYSEWHDFLVSPDLHTSNNYIGAIRNINQIVEIIFTNDPSPTVLYDFNIGVGDTIKNGIGKDENVIIDSIDSVLICGKYRRRYITGLENDFDFKQAIIEGIGFNSGLINHVLYLFEEGSELICYTEKSNTNCEDCDLLLSNKEINVKSKNIIHIIQDENYITLKSNYQINSIYIYGLNGAVIKEIAVNMLYETKIFKTKQLQNQKFIILKIDFLDDFVTYKLPIN